VELDDLLGDEPVQHREVQGNETKAFLELFPRMTVLAGGVDSGFNKVAPKDYRPRLMHVCGFGKTVQVYEVAIKVESLNDSDCFVLDAGLKIYQFNGSKSSAWEKRKANTIVDGLKAARLGKVKDTYKIDGLGDSGSPMIAEFWQYFGGKPAAIQESAPEPEALSGEVSLHQISDASGTMTTAEVGRGRLDRALLVSDDAFILDAIGKIYVWIGRGANAGERREAMAYATEYITANGRDWKTPVARVSEGKEPAEFWAAYDGQIEGGRQGEYHKWRKAGAAAGASAAAASS
jgi:gelsolin